MISLPRNQIYQEIPIQTECPLCHCTSAHLLYIVSSEHATQHIYGDEKTPESAQFKAHIEQLWGGQSCDFVKCDNCSLSYANPFIPGDATFYELAYQDGLDYRSWKWEFQVTLDALRNIFQKQPGRLLEIGAGDGSFVKHITPSLIPKSQAACTEYSIYGRNEIIKYGVQCWPLGIPNLDSSKHGKFDVICMFEVLEHLGSLETAFESLSQIMNDGAHLFIGVPNSFSREFFDLLGFVEDVPPTHITRWNKKSFDILARDCGWRLIEFKIEPESSVSKLKRYAMYHYMRSVFAPYLNALHPGLVRKLLQVPIIAVQLALSLRPIIQLMSNNMGCVQWVHLQKT